MSWKERVHINTPRALRGGSQSSAPDKMSGFMARCSSSMEEDKKDPSLDRAAPAPGATDNDAASPPNLKVSSSHNEGSQTGMKSPGFAGPSSGRQADFENGKFALCEVSVASEAVPEPPKVTDGSVASDLMPKVASPAISSPPPSASEQVSLPKSDLELEIDRCTALGDKLDVMIVEKWGKRCAPILEQSLRFLAAYKAASEEEKQASRKKLKLKSGVSREPNAENLPVIAVYLCVSCAGKTQTKKQRKEWCRFATVVKVAAGASISPDEAAKWLEKKTLNGVLAEWRDMKKATGGAVRKAAVPKALKDYKHLAAALQEGSEFFALAKAELSKAEAAIAKAVADAATSSTMPHTRNASTTQEDMVDA